MPWRTISGSTSRRWVTARPRRSVHLVVGPEVDQKRLLALPAKDDPKVVIDAEGPIGLQLALELVRAQEGIRASVRAKDG